MSRSKGQAILIVFLLLIPIRQTARAAVETIPSSRIPPPPGELVFTFPHSSVPNPGNTRLRFDGLLRGSPSAPTTVSLRYDWTLSSGQEEFSDPVNYLLDPGQSASVASIFIVEGCPNFVSSHFNTDSATGATVSGSFEHTCLTAPEPLSSGVFAIFTGLLAARRSRAG